MDKSEKQQAQRNPREKANPFSIITFAWVLRTFALGYRRELEVTDLYAPLNEHKSNVLGDQISRIWEKEQERCCRTKKGTQPSLLRVLVRCFGPRIMMLGIIIAALEFLVRITQPLMLAGLLRYYRSDNVNGSKMSKDEAYLWAGGIILCSTLNFLVIHPCMLGIMHTGMKIRVACCSLIYRKVLKLSKSALAETTVGQIVNLLSNDVNRFDLAVYFIHYIWLGPLESVVITYLIYREVGWSAVIGMLTLLFFIPLQGYLGKKSSTFRLRIALRTDERIRLMNEIINGIQVIKMYTWEKPFSYLVEIARRKEVNAIKKNSIVLGISSSFDMYTPRLCVFVTILAYVLSGNKITTEQVFMMTAFYNVLRTAMTIAFPISMTQIAEALVSVRRLQKFMLHEEREKPAIKANGQANCEKISNSQHAVMLKNATAKWVPDNKENTLSELNIEIKPGQFVAVIGHVGSGKTSLHHLILRELPLVSGSVEVNGKVAYASQEPWLFASSIRQNILFGRPMDKTRYESVVSVCQLKRDFTLFPYGDKTIVGERGISLSGGQRARINLARAVYSEADIYLFDDPLSAVDAHVGRHLFDECINGYLRGKTRIVATHQHQYLKHVDRIIVMNNGEVEAEGTFEELETAGLDFVKLLQEQVNVPEDNESTRKSLSRKSSIQSMRSEEINDVDPVEEAELRSTGRISAKIYLSYFKAAGSVCFVVTMFLVCILNQGFASGGDYFITYWVNTEETSVNITNGTLVFNWTAPLNRDMCIYTYSGITVATVIFTFLRTYMFVSVCMRASKTLHGNMFRCITRTTMRFFNTNTSGRILNRFSKDMGAIDELLPMSMSDVVQIGLSLLGVIVLVTMINPLLMIPTVIILILLYVMRVIYISTSRSVKRLEGITRSPVFGHLSATLNGLTTIRAFDAEANLSKEFDNHQDLHSSAWYIFISCSRTFGYYLDFTCVIYTGLVTFSFLVLSQETFGGNVGLAITQCIGLTGMLQWGVRQTAEMENHMTSVERVLEYSTLEQEPPLESKPEHKPPEEWPTEGRIQFSNMFLRYDRAEPPVLKNLNFVIMPREKIGIVGRTGAGKSSLISALFRLAYIDGEIFIDDIPSSNLGVHDLRSKISIIPQEPVLFSGRLRENLDPFDEYSDDMLWQALEEVELKEAVNELSGGLNSKMSEGGTNFSVGQRQLVCLARAIVRNNQILVLDEATANVDPQTDVLIQKTIRKKFAGCTVLTIAHRLNTVMDSSKVLVMDAGTMVEFDHPHLLLQNRQGYLYDMVQQTGHSMAENLTKIAEKNYTSQTST
ncbi:probable multidrug resistance-associated protein lethal(2)03659 isoform X1 [Neodiprion pinetum]|uniref:Probable multidrug resistance-associated protein lethal(2)03659 n=1 Tax=Neodiprion lecontei TaxID=441921 RepID=A0A6J0BUT4_NEOLC|nr:probable multidrug resistance-associated protein lethal(2)03659 isoform X1 [Neodiprion lecontei]XP_046475078.1 probable multidrug resistance-associated protein lethal(2)03659 isoform X1 [Neodiprion pinetum]XP_046475080.1 probable multidrug resistance-associated protein lethal(2)03659 isoform X1 [Neodiprion pinetum]XP_046475081.1 probable multidrug resistance-associated protein lethal(2)03659 isoform X1 [Neodiprion pinetum]XP_046475082.1 probable multidrug resistance-associated protein lethal